MSRGRSRDRRLDHPRAQPLEVGDPRLCRVARLGLAPVGEIGRPAQQADRELRRAAARARHGRRAPTRGGRRPRRPPHRPDGVERRAEGEDAVERHVAPAGLQPDGAAGGRRQPDRAARCRCRCRGRRARRRAPPRCRPTSHPSSSPDGAGCAPFRTTGWRRARSRRTPAGCPFPRRPRRRRAHAARRLRAGTEHGRRRSGSRTSSESPPCRSDPSRAPSDRRAARRRRRAGARPAR